MFQEYVDELSNPDYRREQEEYLAQMEREQNVPKNVKLLHPEVSPSVCDCALRDGC